MHFVNIEIEAMRAIAVPSILAGEPVWFAAHVHTIIVNHAHVPADTLATFDEAPTALPAWDPGVAGLRVR